jgi:hypothetical protein
MGLNTEKEQRLIDLRKQILALDIDKNAWLASEPMTGICKNVQHLTIDKLLKDLRQAKALCGKCFKLIDKVDGTTNFIFVQSIEVNGDCSLSKHDFNGEDRGVFAKYLYVTENGIHKCGEPIFALHYLVFGKFVPIEITKHAFDIALRQCLANLKGIDASSDIDAYLSFMNKYIYYANRMTNAQLNLLTEQIDNCDSEKLKTRLQTLREQLQKCLI